MENIKVLIVDDSAVFRTQIAAGISGIEGLEIVGSAANGKRALDQVLEKKIDLIILDMEMPIMNGLQLLEELGKIKSSSQVIMFSAATKNSALNTLQALNNGAFDFVLKPDASQNQNESPASKIREALQPKILALRRFLQKNTDFDQKKIEPVARKVLPVNPEAIVIGSSTGGPGALEKIFTNFVVGSHCPMFIVQHMPPVFTAAFADRLTSISGLQFCEAKHGDLVENNRIYIAPGDYHMKLRKNGSQVNIVLDRSDQRNYVRPAVDFLFETAADVYQSKTLGFVLTGMGEDGKLGSVALKSKGACIVIQNKESCVVWGMPRAVHDVGAYDHEMNLEDIRRQLTGYIKKQDIQTRKAE